MRMRKTKNVKTCVQSVAVRNCQKVVVDQPEAYVHQYGEGRTVRVAVLTVTYFATS